MTAITSAADGRLGGIATGPSLFHGGVAAVTAGVGLQLPMYASAADVDHRLAGMPVDGPAMAGMALIAAGLAAVVAGVIPARRSGAVEPVSVRPLDDAKLTRAHAGLITIVALAVAVAVTKPLTVGFALPGVAGEYGLGPVLGATGGVPIALLPFLTLAGAAVGALTSGWLGDRIGRRPPLLVAGTILVASAACGTLPGYGVGLLACFVTGLGAGALLPLAFVLLSETMPCRHRGWLTVLIGGGGIGSAYLLTSWLASTSAAAETWRVLWLAGLPAGLLLILLARWIPESPRFLISTGRGDEAESVLRRYGGELVRGAPSELAVETGVRSAWRQLLHVSFRTSTLAVLLAGFGSGAAFFGLQSWAPSQLQSTGIDAGTSAGILRDAMLIGLPATLAAAVGYGFWSNRGTMIALAVMTAGALVALALAGIDAGTDATLLSALLAVPIAAAAAMLAVTGAYAAEAYPARIRARASGLAAAAAMAGGAAVVALVGVGIAASPSTVGSIIGAGGLAVAAVVAMATVVETRRRPLERITEGQLRALSATQSEDWDAKWARDDFRPPWRVSAVPGEVLAAVEDGWLPPGGSVVDVGCGAGEIAAWLAGRGYRVTGIDFARAAVARARAEQPAHERLRFAVGDLCAGEPPLAERFDAAVDRGCLHAVPAEVRPDYVRNLAGMLDPGAPLLLVHRVAPGSTAADTEAAVRALLEDRFDVRDVAATLMVEQDEDGAPVTGLAFRATRRPAPADPVKSAAGRPARARAGSSRADVAIVGGGPSGACAAMHLRRQGVDVVLVEKKPFPRYHVGESMTGEAGGVLRRLGLEARLDAAGHAVKHGVNVWGKAAEWFVPVMQRTPDGSLADQYTWQVRRSEFDAMLLDEACARGTELVPGKAVKPLLDDAGGVRGLRVRPSEGGEFDLEADIVLDCSGQATFMAAQGVTGPKYVGAYDKQIAIFSQVANFRRGPGDDGRKSMPGNTHIFYKAKYHWAWAIPLDDEVTSVGVVIPSQYFVERRESKEQFLRRELAELHPQLAGRLPAVDFVEDFHAVPNYSFQVRKFAGPGFICVGDAHRFVDPIFSFGVHVALHEAELAADATMRWLGGQGRGSDELMHAHMVECERRIDVFEDLIDCFWQDPLAFAFFAHARYTESLVDAFAGRGTAEEPLPIVAAARKVLKRTRTYDEEGLFSVPFGSRYQPDDAPRWSDQSSEVKTTEAWMRDA